MVIWSVIIRVEFVNRLKFFFAKCRLYIVTISYLRFPQVYYQAKYRLRPRSDVPSLGECNFIKNSVCWSSYHKASTIDGIKFSYFGQSGKISTKWSVPDCDKLWVYNLHYLNDVAILNGEVSKKLAQSIITNWVNCNKVVSDVGWEPYPTSIRLVNILKFYTFYDDLTPNNEIISSLGKQAHVLFKNLEYHILGNHLFTNAKALIFSGVLIKNQYSKFWLLKGLDVLDREIKEQFLDDGAHFELSPMYHAIMLWDLLDLINLAFAVDFEMLKSRLNYWCKVACDALHWLSTMLHPDGDIAFFNDAAFGVGPKPTLVFEYARQLGLKFENDNSPLITHSNSGYSRVMLDNYSLFVDHASIGPSYLPGHGHADSLSFELSIAKTRIFVNSGTSLYGTGKERLRQRGTQAHNTVCVDQKDSSEVWSGFRVARRANTTLHKAEITNNAVLIDASHDGYLCLPSKILHRRKFQCSENSIVITDNLMNNLVTAVAHFHIHPKISISRGDDKTVKLLLADKKTIITIFFNNEFQIVESSWHPEFGVSVKNKKLLVEINNNKLISTINMGKYS